MLPSLAVCFAYMKLEDAYKLFVTYGRAERLYAPETIEKLREAFISWIQPTFRGWEVERITRLDVLSFRAALVDRGLSPARQYNLVMVLRLFLKFCRAVLKLSSLDPSEVTLPRREEPKVEFLTNDEVRRVLDAVPVTTQTGLRLRVLIEVLIATGLRISEALSLDRAPFEKGARELEIVGKGKRERVIFFSDRSLLWIRKYLSLRSDSCPALFITTTEPPRRLSRNDVSRFFVELRERAGIEKKLTPHLLRHTFCTNLLHNGVDITFIRDLAGHRDIKTTAKYYLGVDRDSLRKVVRSYLDYGFRDAA